MKRKLSRLEECQGKQKEQAGIARRVEHESRPRASVTLEIQGGARGPITCDFPVKAAWSMGSDEAVVEHEALDPISVDSGAFTSLIFAIPGYNGPGRYDLAAIANGPLPNSIDYPHLGLIFGEDERGFIGLPRMVPRSSRWTKMS